MESTQDLDMEIEKKKKTKTKTKTIKKETSLFFRHVLPIRKRKISLPVGSETAGLGSGTIQAVTSKQERTWTHFSNQINRNE